MRACACVRANIELLASIFTCKFMGQSALVKQEVLSPRPELDHQITKDRHKAEVEVMALAKEEVSDDRSPHPRPLPGGQRDQHHLHGEHREV